VAAAFECKTTLITSHIKEAVETAVVVKSLCTPRFGSPYQELRAPIIYGLLAHTRDWKSQGSDPLSNIDNKLRAEDEAVVTTHPRLKVFHGSCVTRIAGRLPAEASAKLE
jgi:hypothetical protein